jgi:FkbM family methyltransferase
MLRAACGLLPFLWTHPLARGRRLRTLLRYLRFQLGARLAGRPLVVEYVAGTRLLAGPGLTSANAVHYVGLPEYEEMAFWLHYLRPEDELIDVGANVGIVTVLAAGAAGCRVRAFEPAPESFRLLEDNLALNRLTGRVTAQRSAVGEAAGTLRFSTGLGVRNAVWTGEAGGGVEVPVTTLAAAAAEAVPTALKIDTEGFEGAVLAGAGALLAEPRLQALQLEFRGHGARYGYDEAALDERLRAAGFRSVVYHPGQRRLEPRAPGRRGDMIYVRDPAAAAERLRAAERFRFGTGAAV